MDGQRVLCWHTLIPILILAASAPGAAAARTLLPDPSGASRSAQRGCNLRLGNFYVRWAPTTAAFSIVAQASGTATQPVFGNPAPGPGATGLAWINAGQGPENPAATYNAAVHVLRSTLGSQTDIQTISDITVTGSEALVKGSLYWAPPEFCNSTVIPGQPAACPPSTWLPAATYSVRFVAASSSKVDYTISWQASADATSRGINLNRLIIRFGAGKDEAFYGLGIQTSSWMHNGRSIPVMNLEPGVGKGEPIITVAQDLDGPGNGGSPFSAYTSIPHLFSSARRSFVLHDSKLSVFDLTATAVPRLPAACPKCGNSPANMAAGIVIPRNQKHEWRCTTASSPDYLAVLQSNKFLATKFVYDLLQPMIQADRLAVITWAAKLVAGKTSIDSLLPDVWAWVKANHPEWLPYINPQGSFGQNVNDVPTLSSANITAWGNVDPGCFQCAHNDCNVPVDASWMPLVPYSSLMRIEACNSARGNSARGVVISHVQVLVYIQPGEEQVVSGFLLTAPSMEAQLEAYTEYSGRMRKLPNWVNNGAIISITGGTDLLLERYNILKAAEVPMSAVWSQDWSGLRLMEGLQRLWWNWRLETNYYSNYTQLQEYLREDGVLMTLYANPYLANDAWGNDSSTFQLYAEGLEKDAYIKCADTTGPYISFSVTTDFSYATVDLTNPAARQWYAEQLAQKMYKDGMSVGNMQDFADQTPFDPKAVMFNGKSAAVMRNVFPELWAQTSRLAMDAAGLSEDGLAWTRSASSQTPRWSTIQWLGDQNVLYDAYDGLKSALLGALSAGLSGLTLVHSDIGGYVAKGKLLPRTKELLLRWSEMSAITDAIMRTHISTDPDTWQVWSPDTPGYFGWLVRIHQALQPYRDELQAEATGRGLPLVRHPMMYFSNDNQVTALQFQVMLGRYVMFCPALGPNQRTVDCYLPGQSADWLPVWGVTLPSSQLTADGGVKCANTVPSKPCWVTLNSPLLPGGNPLTGDVTPEGCPGLLIHRSGLQDPGLKAALANLAALAAKYGNQCGGVLLQG